MLNDACISARAALQVSMFAFLYEGKLARASPKTRLPYMRYSSRIDAGRWCTITKGCLATTPYYCCCMCCTLAYPQSLALGEMDYQVCPHPTDYVQATRSSHTSSDHGTSLRLFPPPPALLQTAGFVCPNSVAPLSTTAHRASGRRVSPWTTAISGQGASATRNGAKHALGARRRGRPDDFVDEDYDPYFDDLDDGPSVSQGKKKKSKIPLLPATLSKVSSVSIWRRFEKICVYRLTKGVGWGYSRYDRLTVLA